MDSPYNFSIQNCHQNGDRVQLGFQSPKWCIIKHLKHTKLYSIEFLRTEMTSDLSNYHREYSPYRSYSLFQLEGSEVISVLKNSIEYSFVFFKCLLKREPKSTLCNRCKPRKVDDKLLRGHVTHCKLPAICLAMLLRHNFQEEQSIPKIKLLGISKRGWTWSDLIKHLTKTHLGNISDNMYRIGV